MLLDPFFHIDERDVTVGLGRQLPGGDVLIRNPGLPRSSCVPCEHQPHQASRAITIYGLALEQQGAQKSLGLILALVSRKRQPADSLLRILADAATGRGPAICISRP
jgi:hypothetical protein